MAVTFSVAKHRILLAIGSRKVDLLGPPPDIFGAARDAPRRDRLAEMVTVFYERVPRWVRGTGAKGRLPGMICPCLRAHQRRCSFSHSLSTAAWRGRCMR